MALPRFKMQGLPPNNPNLTARENEEGERHVKRVNSVKSAFNKLLDVIDKDGRQDQADFDDNGPDIGT